MDEVFLYFYLSFLFFLSFFVFLFCVPDGVFGYTCTNLSLPLSVLEMWYINCTTHKHTCPKHRTFMRHFPSRPLYVADYFPISHSSVGFELALAARCAARCRVTVARIAVLANRLLTIIADLFNRLLLTRLSRRGVAHDGGAAMMARWARNCLDGASAPFVLVRDVLQKLYSLVHCFVALFSNSRRESTP